MIASGFRLGITCSFCGGALEIDEASRAVRCQHCASILKIIRHGREPQYFVRDQLDRSKVKFHIESHFHKHELPLPSRFGAIDQYYVPFWYVHGTVCTIQKRTASDVFATSGPETEWYEESPQVQVKILERSISLCADSTYPWGLTSLGVRPQVIQLTPVDKAFLENHIVRAPDVKTVGAQKRFGSAVNATAQAVAISRAEVDTTAVGTNAMLIFFPIWLAEIMSVGGKSMVHFDPVAKRVASVTPGDEIPKETRHRFRHEYGIEITAHRCPNCGADLPESATSETFYCKNCRRLLLDKQDRYETLRLVVPREFDKESRLFPFWIFDLSQASGTSVGDFERIRKVARFDDRQYIMPAFKVSNPGKLLRLLQHYNRTTHEIQFDEYPDDHYNFTDVDLNPQEAAEMIMPLTVACAASMGFKIAGLDTEKLSFSDEPRLMWLPYALDRYFWREQITGATIEKAAVKI